MKNRLIFQPQDYLTFFWAKLANPCAQGWSRNLIRNEALKLLKPGALSYALARYELSLKVLTRLDEEKDQISVFQKNEKYT